MAKPMENKTFEVTWVSNQCGKVGFLSATVTAIDEDDALDKTMYDDYYYMWLESIEEM
jgi:hypothetical protein